jgi:methionyl-tRNA synthetase
VVPDFRVAELRNAVEKLEGDLCISRPKARLEWGIPFPFDAEFVTYVWFDALVNYISFAPGYDPVAGANLSEFKKWWPALHVIGKDIMIPAHGVYWPIMLKAIGFPDDEIPPLLVHGWWNVGGAKMSKSLGNVVDPNALADKYGAETLRYYLMSDIATGRDADFSEERLVQRYNTDLANSLGNLLNRSLTMVQKYRGGKLGSAREFSFAALGEFTSSQNENELMSLVANFPPTQGMVFVSTYASYFESHRPSVALEQTWDAVRACNALIDAAAPWKLAKDPALADRLDAVLYYLAESLRIVAILISPVLPNAAASIFAQLNWNGPMILSEATWGKLPDGHQLGAPTPLFPRRELPAE